MHVWSSNERREGAGKTNRAEGRERETGAKKTAQPSPPPPPPGAKQGRERQQSYLHRSSAAGSFQPCLVEPGSLSRYTKYVLLLYVGVIVLAGSTDFMQSAGSLPEQPGGPEKERLETADTLLLLVRVSAIRTKLQSFLYSSENEGTYGPTCHGDLGKSNILCRGSSYHILYTCNTTPCADSFLGPAAFHASAGTRRVGSRQPPSHLSTRYAVRRRANKRLTHLGRQLLLAVGPSTGTSPCGRRPPNHGVGTLLSSTAQIWTKRACVCRQDRGSVPTRRSEREQNRQQQRGPYALALTCISSISAKKALRSPARHRLCSCPRVWQRRGEQSDRIERTTCKFRASFFSVARGGSCIEWNTPSQRAARPDP